MSYTTDAVRVEVAWGTAQALSTSPAWEDMTALVALEQGITWNRGRPDAQSQVSPGSLNFALRNDGGDYTPGKVSSPRYPNVVLGRRARVTVRQPASAGNFVAPEDASFEGGTVGNWTGNVLGSVAATIANSTTFAQNGTHSLQVTWGTGGSSAGVFVGGLVIGRSYTATAYVLVPAASPSVAISIYNVATGTNTGATTGAFVRLTVTFVATQTTHFLSVSATGPGTAYVDAVQLDEAVGTGVFTTASPPISTRFDGTFNSLDVAMTDTGAVTLCGATDLLKQIGDNRPLRSILAEEILNDGPTRYWPLGEPSGASAAGDISGSGGNAVLAPTQLGAGGTCAFGAGTGPAFDQATATVFTPASVGNGVYLSGAVDMSNGASVVSACYLGAMVNTSTAAVQVIARPTMGGSYLSLEVTAASKLLATLVDNGVTMGTVTSASNVTGGTKHAAVTVTLAGTTATLTLWLDGVSAGTATWTQPTGYLYFYNAMNIGGTGAGSLLTGTVSHVEYGIAAPSSTRIKAHRDAGLTGFIGELSGTRAARLLRLAGVPAALVNTEAGLSTMDSQVTGGQSGIAALQDVATAERGVLFAAADGRITFHGRAHRYNAAASATFDAEADLGSADMRTSLNDQQLINDVTGTRTGGATQRATNASSVNVNGTYAQNVALLVDSDALAKNIVTSIANTWAVPQPRAPELPIDILTMSVAQATAALALDVGARADAVNMPAAAPASTLSLFVEGVAESVTQASWDVKFSTAPATYTAVWVLDSPTYSQLNSSTILAL